MIHHFRLVGVASSFLRVVGTFGRSELVFLLLGPYIVHGDEI